MGLLPASPIMVSVAAYVQDGRLLTGVYVQLGRITDNLQIELAREVSVQLGEVIGVTLIHDGTAAATTYAGMKDTAVITIGTALGIGFPPKAAGLRPINDEVIITR
jgi:hypothetical protein